MIETQCNVDEYLLLFEIETGLREFICEELEVAYGAKWWRQRVPSGAKDKAKSGKEYERSQAWQDRVIYHQIHYVDFPNLREIIERSDNWNECFSRTFNKKDQVMSAFASIEPTRNRIAHCRPCTAQDRRALETVKSLMLSSIGEARWRQLSSVLTTVEDGVAQIENLVTWVADACAAIANEEQVSEGPDVQPWLVAAALGENVQDLIDEFVCLASDYSALPTGIGSLLLRQNWPHKARAAAIGTQIATDASLEQR